MRPALPTHILPPWFAGVLAGLALSLLYFTPLFGLSAIPGVFPDTFVTTWAAWWCQKYTSTGQQHLYFSSDIFAPDGASLLLHNLSEGIFVPLSLLLRGHTAPELYTASCWVAFFLNFFSMYAVLGTWTSSVLTRSWLASLFAFHPFFLAHLAGGHLNLISYFALPVVLHSVHHIRERDSSLYSQLLLGVALGVTVYLDLYLFYFSLLLCGVLILFPARNGFVRRAGRAASAGALGLCIASPKLLSVLALGMSRRYTSNHDPSRHGADLSSYLLPGPTQWLGGGALSELTSRLGPNWAESGTYLGITCLVLVASLYWTAERTARRETRPYLFCALLFFVLSFGPRLHVHGAAVMRLPLYDAMLGLPFFPTVPARFFIVGWLALLVALAILLRSVPRRAVLYSAIAATVIEFFPMPISRTVLPRSEVLEALAHEPGIRRVMDLGGRESSMYRHMLHRRPIVGGFLARRPRAAERALRRNSFLRYVAGSSVTPDLPGSLDRLGVDAVILEAGDHTLRERLDRVPFLARWRGDDTVVVYRLQYTTTARSLPLIAGEE